MSDGYLIDTSVLSAFAPGRPAVSKQTAIWMRAQGEAGQLHLSVITVSEIQRGLRKLQRAGGIDRAKALSGWLGDLINVYGDRLLPIDAVVARMAGDIEEQAISDGAHPDLADVLIAATARAHSLDVLTANSKHFMPLGIACFNPLQQIPPMEPGLPKRR